MKKRQMFKMIFSVILPPVSVLIFFIVAIGVIILPATEDALMEKKQDVIKSIVMSATSIIEKHSQMEREGLVSKEEAQLTALSEMRALRYGSGNTDYLWITDLKPIMVMHPYFPELEGTLLDDYTDSEGKLLFVEAAEIAKSKGEGFFDYMWPKQDLQESQPKLSYIRLFEPWGWIVGSGVYLDDVQAEIDAVTLHLIRISVVIGVFVVALLAFDIFRGLKSEHARQLAQRELVRSRERYQALAHASREMVFLTIDGTIAGANKMACETLGMDEEEIISRSFDEFFSDPSGLRLIASKEKGNSKDDIEMSMIGKNGLERVLLSAEHVFVHNRPAVMYAGYSLQLKDNPDNVLTVRDSLSRTGFGIIRLDNALSGKIISADRMATELMTGSSGMSLVGKAFRSLVNEGDASRLFLQLESTGQVSNLLLRHPSEIYGTGYLQASAAVAPDARDSSDNIMLFLSDATKQQSVHLAADDLLSELMSPQNRIMNGNSFLDQACSEITPRQRYVRTQVVLREAVKTGLAPDKIAEVMTNSIQSIYRSSIEKAIIKLGPPPCEYTLLAIGSVGRLEPTFNADQDTALIYESGDKEAVCAEYFQHFGTLVTSYCADAGIPPCHAENTVANPKWCMSETAWKYQFSSWIHNSEPEALLFVNIFFDFSVVSGNEKLAASLQQHIFKEVEKRSVFLYNLAQNTLEFRTPANILGQIRSDSRTDNSVDLKGVMMHFVNFARVYALKNAIDETNTVKRLQALMEGHHIGLDTGEETIDAWKFLMSLRLKNQVAALELNFPQENTLMLKEISSWEMTMLKKAMAQVNNLQKKISSDIVSIGR